MSAFYKSATDTCILPTTEAAINGFYRPSGDYPEGIKLDCCQEQDNTVCTVMTATGNRWLLPAVACLLVAGARGYDENHVYFWTGTFDVRIAMERYWIRDVALDYDSGGLVRNYWEDVPLNLTDGTAGTESLDSLQYYLRGQSENRHIAVESNFYGARITAFLPAAWVTAPLTWDAAGVQNQEAFDGHYYHFYNDDVWMRCALANGVVGIGGYGLTLPDI